MEYMDFMLTGSGRNRNQAALKREKNGGEKMKIKVKEMSYNQVLALPAEKHIRPRRPNILFRTLLKLLSWPELCATHFTWEKEGMERLEKDEPCLVLMNHSSFIDLKIAAFMLYPRPFNIVCTSDGFVGKNWLMRLLGCIPTTKFVTDLTLVKDMHYALKELHSSVLLFPEASYSFDGTATPLPDSMGKCIKALGVPVVMIRTYGAFARDPLYNNLQRRRVKVSAKMEYLLSSEEIALRTPEELNGLLAEWFAFDNFLWQQQNHVRISEPFRADYLNRVLYKCPHCLTEGKMRGKGSRLVCENCGAAYELTEYGYLRGVDMPTDNQRFNHVPDWYRWERECVRQELAAGSYRLQIPVDICMLVNSKCIYRVGSGMLEHSPEGFHLTGCEGQLDYVQKPSASYSLYADYYWYELGDMICIGDHRALYYCFPQNGQDVAAKTRLAAEELYQMKKRSGHR
ncbi:MAG: 1-acyl-sn-glycerol-3-phosphate acyltransferase [Acetatifactor sp.]|nr:1-acyl-sn-glycerol-3-phosphate acyltransferase [Acetatifactor sp.]